MLKEIIFHTIEREKRLLAIAIAKTQTRVNDLAKLHHIESLEDVFTDTVERNEANEMDLIDMEGELQILQHLKKKWQVLKEVCVS